MMKAAPRQMPITPSVAMNGGSRTRTISHDESSPARDADQQPRDAPAAAAASRLDEQVAR